MKIKKDDSGNIWVDGELCINVPVKIDHVSQLQLRTTIDYSYEDITKIVDDSIHYYLCGVRNG